MKYSPDHFVANARPSRKPAPNRHHRTPNRGPQGVSSMRPSSSASCIRARIWSRSTSRAPKAATTKTVMKVSSSAVRDATKLTPSTTTSSPAIAPMSVERLIRRTALTTRAARMIPNTALVNLQPTPL